MTERCEQLELPLFSPPSFAEILSGKGIRNVAVTTNTRLKNTWRVKIHPLSGRRALSVPPHFEDAPEKVKAALIEWSLLAPLRKSRKRRASSQRKKELEHFVWEYITANGKPLENIRNISPAAFRSVGRRYDLQEVFNCLNAAYFNGKLSAHIRWNKSRRRSYQTTYRDAQGQRHNLISIARIYDQLDVPRHAIEGIVFHEMLHIAIPPYKRGFQNVIHGREFKRAERSFPYFKQWRQWEKERLKINVM